MPLWLKTFVSSTSLLRQEYEQAAQLFSVQPALTQRFIEAQARQMAEAIVQRTPQVRFTLPHTGRRCSTIIGSRRRCPPVIASKLVGGSKILDRLARVDVHKLLRQRLAELEHDPQREVSISATLLRYATVIYMVHVMLPAGRSVKYEAVDGEEIPTLPKPAGPGSALTAATMRLSKRASRTMGAVNCWSPIQKRRASSTCRSGWRWMSKIACWSTR